MNDQLPDDVREDWKWAKRFDKSAMEAITSYLFTHIVTRSLSDMVSDTQEATDAIIELPAEFGPRVKMGMRVRRVASAGRYRDVTIRSTRASGAKTELQKLREGHCSLIFYAWIDQDDDLEEYVIVDVEVMRRAGLLDDSRPQTWNRDRRSAFVSYSIEELQKCGALVDGAKFPGRSVCFRWVIRQDC